MLWLETYVLFISTSYFPFPFTPKVPIFSWWACTWWALAVTFEKNVQTMAQLHSSHMLAKQCSKFSNPVFNCTWTEKFQMFKLNLEKPEEPEIKLPTSIVSSKKQESSRKNIYFSFIDYTKALDCVDYNKLWNILKEMEISHHLTCLLINLHAGQEATVRIGHGKTDWFQIRKGVCQGCIVTLLI